MCSPASIHRAPVKKWGFTVIELFLAVAIGVLVVGLAFLQFDPGRRSHAARNEQRWSDAHAILQAIRTSVAENGALPVSLDTETGSVQIIGDAPGNCASLVCADQIIAPDHCAVSDLESLLLRSLKRFPKDPKTGTVSDTRYYVNRDLYGIVTVGACDTEGEGPGGGGMAPLIEVTQ